MCSNLVGVDISERGIELLKDSYGFNNVFVADLEEIDATMFHQPFDVILGGELIEHLNNLGKFLCGLKTLMTPNTLLVLTTPNTYGMKLVLYTLIGRERVNEDHRFFFSFSTLKRLLEVQSFCPVRWYTALEKTGGRRNAVLNKLLYPLFKGFPRYCDTIICVAKLSNV